MGITATYTDDDDDDQDDEDDDDWSFRLRPLAIKTPDLAESVSKRAIPWMS